jgi:hypothetical protein
MRDAPNQPLHLTAAARRLFGVHRLTSRRGRWTGSLCGKASAGIPMQSYKNPTVSALFGVAAIQILVGTLGWFMYSPQFGWLDWIVTLSGVLYLGLAVAARWVRLVAALIAIGLFGAYLGYQASVNAELLWRGLIIKAPIAVLLLVALFFAIRHRARRQQNPESHLTPPV